VISSVTPPEELQQPEGLLLQQLNLIKDLTQNFLALAASLAQLLLFQKQKKKFHQQINIRNRFLGGSTNITWINGQEIDLD
jgi:hypothetical protein